MPPQRLLLLLHVSERVFSNRPIASNHGPRTRRFQDFSWHLRRVVGLSPLQVCLLLDTPAIDQWSSTDVPSVFHYTKHWCTCSPRRRPGIPPGIPPFSGPTLVGCPLSSDERHSSRLCMPAGAGLRSMVSASRRITNTKSTQNALE